MTVRAGVALLLALAVVACSDGDAEPPPRAVADAASPSPSVTAPAVDVDEVLEGRQVPPPSDTTSDWLATDGAVLLDALLAAAPLATLDLDEDPVPVCRAVAAALDDLGTPASLRELAGSAPDAEARTLLLNDLTTKVQVLGACGPELTQPVVDEAAFTHAVLLSWTEGR